MLSKIIQVEERNITKLDDLKLAVGDDAVLKLEDEHLMVSIPIPTALNAKIIELIKTEMQTRVNTFKK